MITVTHENFRFYINKQKETALLFKCKVSTGSLVIPSYVQFQDENYKVISIEKDSFSGNFDSITFSPDSEVKIFKDGAFGRSIIKKLEIPPKLETLGVYTYDSNHKRINSIEDIELSPQNQHFQYFNEKVLVGKDSYGEDNIFYIRPDMKEVHIPPCIQVLKYTYNNYPIREMEIESIIFDDSSQIQRIESLVFGPSLKKLHIPKSLQKFDKDCFNHADNLVDITVSPENHLFQYVENKFLVSNDTLVFCRRDATEVTIPRYIKRIGPYAFSKIEVDSITFEDNSSLERIEKHAFEIRKKLDNIIFPPSLKFADQYSFNLQNTNSIVFLGEDVKLNNCFFLCCNLYLKFPNAKKLSYSGFSIDNIKFYVKKDIQLEGDIVTKFLSHVVFVDENDNSKWNEMLNPAVKTTNITSSPKNKPNKNNIPISTKHF